MAVRGQQAIVVVPIHLKLPIGIFMVILVGAPTEIDHGIAYLLDDVIAAHQRRLVVTRFFLGIARIGDRGSVRRRQEILALHTTLHVVAALYRLFDLPLQGNAGRGLHWLAVHPQIRGQPSDFRFPGKLDQAIGIRNGEHVRIGR